MGDSGHEFGLGYCAQPTWTWSNGTYLVALKMDLNWWCGDAMEVKGVGVGNGEERERERVTVVKIWMNPVNDLRKL